MSDIKERLVDWFDTSEALHYSGEYKVVYQNPLNNDISLKLFDKDSAGEFNGFCQALREFRVEYVSQAKGYGLWYFYKGAVPYKIRDWK